MAQMYKIWGDMAQMWEIYGTNVGNLRHSVGKLMAQFYRPGKLTASKTYGPLING
jgi:hypothetical protein